MNLYSQPTNYTALLNSQQDPQSFSFESHEPSVQLGSSQLPVFGTQYGEGSSLDGDTPSEPKERNAWNPPDDHLLISAWLNTSKDPITSNEQKLQAFWTRISVYVTANAKAAGRTMKREPTHYKNRWQKISGLVTKFSGAYAAATRERASGENDVDVLKKAHQIFYKIHKKKFILEYAWSQLRHDQKWCELSTSKTDSDSKRRKFDDGSNSATSSAADEAQTRPPGVKAAKAKAKKSVEEGKNDVELRTIMEIKNKDYEMKKKDNEMKDTLADKKILDSLIAKTEPLSEAEEALKEKLISLIYS
ncbi:unnamed protein product [Microthlaspi erraticum]|uniref:No apical meristem-associated C-terminal domain-containing protein n=1 Tax=Microthlaspi erraticum TaxID=1685480 RepID=A0A6D2J811_9BRAS|nr:unnamed protein product [Microthlaspi erraticum]